MPTLERPDFLKTTQQVSTGKMFTSDPIATVIGFDVDKEIMTVKHTRINSQQPFNVRVTTFNNKPKPPIKAEVDWEGNHIDNRMAETIKPGMKVVLEGLIQPENIETVDKTLAARWITLTPENESKHLSGIVSAQGFYSNQDQSRNKIFSVGVWHPTAYDVGTQELKQWLVEFDKVNLEYNESKQAYHKHLEAVKYSQATGAQLPEEPKHPIKHIEGFMIRCLMGSGHVAGYSNALSKLKKKDELINKEFFHALDSSYVISAIQYYQELMKTLYPDEKTKVDVLRYQHHPASNTLNPFPIRHMATATGNLWPDEEMQQYGGHYVAAEEAAILFSPGKLQRGGERKGEQNYIVNQVKANGKKISVPLLIKQSNGMKPQGFVEGLNIKYPVAKPVNSQQTSTTTSSISTLSFKNIKTNDTGEFIALFERVDGSVIRFDEQNLKNKIVGMKARGLPHDEEKKALEAMLGSEVNETSQRQDTQPKGMGEMLKQLKNSI